MKLSVEEKSILTSCGNEDSCSSVDFDLYLKNAERKLREDKLSDQEEKDPRTHPIEIAVLTFLTLAAQQNIGKNSFASALLDLNWNEVRLMKLWNLYEQEKRKLRWTLSSHTSLLPCIVDLKWKLNLIVKDFLDARTKDILFMIKIQTYHPILISHKEITFCCSTIQMSHLLYELRKASRSLHNFSSSLS